MKRDLFAGRISHLLVATIDRVKRGDTEFFRADCKMNNCELVVYEEQGKSLEEIISKDLENAVYKKVAGAIGKRGQVTKEKQLKEFGPLIEFAKKLSGELEGNTNATYLRGAVNGLIGTYNRGDRSKALLEGLRDLKEEYE